MSSDDKSLFSEDAIASEVISQDQGLRARALYDYQAGKLTIYLANSLRMPCSQLIFFV